MPADETRLPELTASGFTKLLAQHMPQVERSGISVRSMDYGVCRLRMPVCGDYLRFGGSLSGPTMFALADLAFYGAVMSRIGPAMLAVTSTMTITFLRRPALKPLLADGRIFRVGRRLAYGDVSIFSEGEDEPVAHATGSYAIPGGAASP